MIKLMYITNKPNIAWIAERSGVDRIFLDMESIGKAQRQCGMDTVLSSHTIDDIVNIRNTVHKSEVLVRSTQELRLLCCLISKPWEKCSFFCIM